ncbi:MAG: hypothetical protein HC904_02340 [Blastochloris sp.]|nr:hypothetical protein [Blastochloris sp.]
MLRNLSIYDLETYPGMGKVFLEDVRCKQVVVNASTVYARQLNPEGHEEPRILNKGGMFWVLGLKTENDTTVLKVMDGGKAEVLGGFGYANKDKLPFKQYFVNDNASLSATYGGWKTKNGRAFDVMVTETQGEETRQLKKADATNRGYSSMMVLYSGRKE